MKQMTIFDYPIEKARAGVITTYETRAESNAKVDRQRRYSQILEILKDFARPMSAKQIAVEMKNRGYSASDDRNVAAPRLNELSKTGYVQPYGKAKCEYTKTMVTFYELRKEGI